MRDNINKYFDNLVIKNFYEEYLAAIEAFAIDKNIEALNQFLLSNNYSELISNLKCLEILNTDNLDAFCEDLFNKILPILKYMQEKGYQYNIDNKRYVLLLLVFPLGLLISIHNNILDDSDPLKKQKIINKLAAIDNNLFDNFNAIYQLMQKYFLTILHVKNIDISYILSNDMNIVLNNIQYVYEELVIQFRYIKKFYSIVDTHDSIDFLKAVEIYENSILIEDDVLNFKEIYNIMNLNPLLKSNLIKDYILSIIQYVYIANREILNFFHRKQLDKYDQNNSLQIYLIDFKKDPMIENLQDYINNLQYAFFQRFNTASISNSYHFNNQEKYLNDMALSFSIEYKLDVLINLIEKITYNITYIDQSANKNNIYQAILNHTENLFKIIDNNINNISILQYIYNQKIKVIKNKITMYTNYFHKNGYNTSIFTKILNKFIS